MQYEPIFHIIHLIPKWPQFYYSFVELRKLALVASFLRKYSFEFRV